MPRHCSRCVAWWSTILLLAACAHRADQELAVVVRDSAGIHIVEDGAPMWTDITRWQVSSAPLLDIGADQNDPDQQLYDVSGVLRLSDGRIIVADGGTRELRFYDRTGRLAGRAGREGEGPGEFRNLGSIRRLADDSILAWDPRLRRMSIFDATGRFARSASLANPPGGNSLSPIAVLADGTLLARPGFTFSAQTTTGLHQDTLQYFRFRTDGSLMGPVGRFPGAQMYVYSEGGHSMAGPHVFGRSPVLSPDGMGFIFGAGATWELERHAADGRLLGLIRRREPPRRLAAEDIARLKREWLADQPSAEQRAFFERYLAAMPIPERLPAYRALRVAANGAIWVHRYALPGEDDTRWSVFDAQGRLLGELDLPPGFDPNVIGTDYLLGVATDSLGVEHVQLWALRGAG